MSDEVLTAAMAGDGLERGHGDDRRVVGYMCRIDWNYELGSAIDGNKVYPSVQDLRASHTCADACGIVAVEVRLVCVVVEGTDP